MKLRRIVDILAFYVLLAYFNFTWLFLHQHIEIMGNWRSLFLWLWNAYIMPGWFVVFVGPAVTIAVVSIALYIKRKNYE